MTPDQQDAIADAAAELQSLVGQVIAVMTRAHAAGVAIPPRAAEAAQVLDALRVCWHFNGQGLPAPTMARSVVLGPEAPTTERNNT